MSKDHIEHLIKTALNQSKVSSKFSEQVPTIQIESTRDKQHGDYATNIALLLAKVLGDPPRTIAQHIVQAIPASSLVSRVEIAGPGFINFFLTPRARYAVVTDILTQRERFGCSNVGAGKRVIVEFVSSNPTGPLHVGHGRHGAYGSVVANLLASAGYNVWREYYVNDAGRQMDILATSVWLRYLVCCNETLPFPANGYRGKYVIDIAETLKAQHGMAFVKSSQSLLRELPKDESEGGDREIYIDALIARAKNLLGKEAYEIIFGLALDTILADIREDLATLGVTYQNWFSERAFTQTDAVDRVIDFLTAKGLTYEQDEALWFRATAYGDEKDRVLRRSNGVRTYFANDLAYHVNKFERGFELAVDIFGADHHGYFPRVKAGLEAFDVKAEAIQAQLVQFVTLYRGGEQVQMSTRSGSFVTLRELREEVGVDATRFFYLMRKCGQHVDFDLDLAKSQSNDNPVYYIQYAHARICSVFKQLAERGWNWDKALGEKHLTTLTEPNEQELLTCLAHYPEMLASAVRQREPQVLTSYLRELANNFHAYYNACHFLVEDELLRNARLALIESTRQVLVNALQLLGISAPESM